MLQFNTLNDVRLYFATPVVHLVWPDASRHNAALKALIEEKRRDSPGVKISNYGGWQSKDDFLSWGGESVAALTQWFHASVMRVYQTLHGPEFTNLAARHDNQLQWKGTAWANINGRGDWNSTHNHAVSHWSGVYYVQVPPNSGRLAILDPRPNINMMDTGSDLFDIFRQAPLQIEPREGLTVIFPSWLQHQVTTHESDAERISIAYNLRFLLGNWR
jgi:uncharacterized protein (TIGR02466 family)